MTRVGFALTLGAALVLAGRMRAGAQTPQSSAPPPSGTGLIIGQVIDGSTGRPVPEAMVDLLPAGAIAPPTASSGSPRGRVIADSNGRFFFAELPANRYNLRALKPGYMDSRGIVRRPMGPPTPIDLADGQKILDVKMPIWKFATIAGTVVDEAGEAVVGAEVRALRRAIVGGVPRYSSPQPAYARTDDRGYYRIANLTPGDYVIVVPATLTTMPMSFMVDPFGRQGQEASRAIGELSILGSDRNQQIGDSVLMSLHSSPLPAAPSGGQVSAYLTAYSPSLGAGGQASALTLGPGEERNVNVQLRLASAVKVSGTLVGPAGPLGGRGLRLVPAWLGEVAAEGGLEVVTGLSADDGTFALLGVPPGQYLLRLRTPPTNTNSPTPPSTTEGPALWAIEPITVGDADLSGLMITARPLFTITGSIDPRGTNAALRPDQLAELYVNLDAVTGGASGAAKTDQSGAFAIGMSGGRFTARVETPEGWRVKSIEFDGRDATDGALDIKGDASLRFVITDDHTMISGTVRDDRGAPDANGSVAIFPAIRALWTGYPITGWRVRSTQTSVTGAYSIADFPAGEYFVTSIPDAMAETWMDPHTLEILSRTAARVTIGNGESRTQDLRRSDVR